MSRFSPRVRVVVIIGVLLLLLAFGSCAAFLLLQRNNGDNFTDQLNNALTTPIATPLAVVPPPEPPVTPEITPIPTPIPPPSPTPDGSLEGGTTPTPLVVSALQILPGSEVVASGASHTFDASGGVPPYSFDLSVNESGGIITTTIATGKYTAGPTSGVSDTVRVTDANGTTATATVQVNPPLQILSHRDGVAPVDRPISIFGGGMPPYGRDPSADNSFGNFTGFDPYPRISASFGSRLSEV